jgi:NTP pyrophosphatase (non-canonical NTP hydrolase)
MSDVKTIIADVLLELDGAIENWPKFNSAHEGYAILAEEMDELWDQVKVNQKRRDLDKMYSEAKQVAAMAIRYMIDVCNEETINK